jgi:hypothetical protein
MTQEHPITPPPKLAARWVNEIYGDDGLGFDVPLHPITLRLIEHAAQWGADQELEACLQWLNHKNQNRPDWGLSLQDARRPKPPSLKEQALLQLDVLNADLAMHGLGTDLSQIRRALEQLDD